MQNVRKASFQDTAGPGKAQSLGHGAAPWETLASHMPVLAYPSTTKYNKPNVK